MKKKSFIMVLSAVMILMSVAFGTIAYLTDRETLKNTFTVGNVDIVVDEENLSGNPAEPDRTQTGNEYNIAPGGVYKKDPTLTVKAGSEEAYVRMMVEISHADELENVLAELQVMYPQLFGDFTLADCVEGWNESVWMFHGMKKVFRSGEMMEDDYYFVLEFRYPAAVSAPDGDLTLPPLFTHLTVPQEVTGHQLRQLQGMTVEVTGHAIQVSGFENDMDAAWNAFDAQNQAEANLLTP